MSELSTRELSRRHFVAGAAAATAGLVAAACGPLQPTRGPAATLAAARSARAPYTLQVWEHAFFKWREDVGKEITDPCWRPTRG